jgi:energy-coupling factor transporter ATP-binding protein EcfA2
MMDDRARSEPSAQLFLERSGITRIIVEKLFGQFTYNLTPQLTHQGHSSRLLLLYGDNGSGKTTILRTLFYLLSHVDKEGHKTQVTKIKFKKFSIEFANGVTVAAKRDDCTESPFDLSIYRDGRLVAEAPYGRDEGVERGRVSDEEYIRKLTQQRNRDKEHLKVLATLEGLKLGMIYLADSRDILTTVSEFGMITREDEDAPPWREYRQPSESGRVEAALNRAVEQISSWATRQALKGSAKGEEDVNSAYVGIVKRIAYPGFIMTQNPSSPAQLLTALDEQERRSDEFVRFGLTKPLRFRDIVNDLSGMDLGSQKIAVGILEPYVASVKARLDALDPIRVQLAGFVDTMRDFYAHKRITLDVNHGLTICSDTGEELAPKLLSSGEGRLLYLLATTIIAKDKSNLFMIDEPEISLNVKWQRQLLRALLFVTQGSGLQFLLATHSMELLTRYSEFVLELEPQESADA